MKVVFLDIDGVLNNTKRFRAPKGTYVLDPIACGMFVKFVEDNRIAVVLSSTWRLYEDHVLFLTQAGILDNLHEDGQTLELEMEDKWQPPTRADEVQEWLNRHPEVTHYVIFDDWENGFTEKHAKHFIKTNEHLGLQPEHINKAIEILEINNES